MTKTTSDTIDALRFPIGRFVVPEKISAADRAKLIEEIAAAPAALRAAVRGMSVAENVLLTKLDHPLQRISRRRLAAAARPIDDVRGTAAYRRHVLAVMGARALARVARIA